MSIKSGPHCKDVNARLTPVHLKALYVKESNRIQYLFII